MELLAVYTGFFTSSIWSDIPTKALSRSKLGKQTSPLAIRFLTPHFFKCLHTVYDRILQISSYLIQKNKLAGWWMEDTGKGNIIQDRNTIVTSILSNSAKSNAWYLAETVKQSLNKIKSSGSEFD